MTGETSGKVSLVGAGPGDPDLITVAGLERLAQADVVVYDRLVSDALLKEARGDAEMIYMGKIPGAENEHDQEAINRLLIEKAGQGLAVVRLKGGDPFVFGRGGEEAQALHDAGIDFEVVPGVTSAVAVPAYAGIPITHRGLASSFAVVTGHEDPGKEESAIHWQELATAVDTLVFLMGTQTLPEIAEKLIAHGRASATPVAVIQWGTTPEQRTVTGTLADIAQRVEDAGLRSPAITIVGEVVRLRDELTWFENRPLFGRRVLITRTRDQASLLAARLSEEGALPVELPTIEITEMVDGKKFDAAVEKLLRGYFDWIVFTSENGAAIFFDHLWSRELDARALNAGVAAIGSQTAKTLFLFGVLADLVPEEYVAEGLLRAFEEQFDLKGQKVLLARAKGARDALLDGLRKQGAIVEELRLYEATIPKQVSAEALELVRDGRIDIVTFTSSSTVRNLLEMLNGDMESLKKSVIACIGPVTAKTAKELGLRVDVTASEYTVEGLVAAIKERVPAKLER